MSGPVTGKVRLATGPSARDLTGRILRPKQRQSFREGAITHHFPTSTHSHNLETPFYGEDDLLTSAPSSHASKATHASPLTPLGSPSIAPDKMVSRIVFWAGFGTIYPSIPQPREAVDATCEAQLEKETLI